MKNKLVIFFGLIGNLIFAQCPNTQLYDLELTVASSNPIWNNCIDNEGIPDAYTLDLISPNNIVNYTIDWGDGVTESGASWTAGSIVSHDYTDLGKYTVVLQETQNGCTSTVTGTLISDRKPGATATPPTLNTSGCVPHDLTFINKTNNISQFTNFIWDWGDGTTTEVAGNSTDPGAVNVPISHTFQKGSSSCGMSVQLIAMSLCDTTFVIYGPYDFYDIDTARVGASSVQICVGDTVTFNDLTGYNCIPGTRRIQWDLSDFGGGITPWLPATPQNKQKKYYLEGPVGTVFNIALRDSNTCGIDSREIQVEVIAPPTSVPIVVDDSICQGETGQFRNESTGGSSYIWLWGDNKQTSTTSKNIQNHVYTASGTFDVALITSNSSSKRCVDTAYTRIEVSPAPNVSFSTSVSEGCDLVNTTFTNTSSSVLKSFQWTFDNGTTNSVDNSVLVSYPTKGYFIPTLVGTNAFNCQTVADDTILVLPKPKVIFSDDSLCFGELYETNNQSSIESFPSGSLIHEVFDNINGTSIASLTGSAKFNSGLADRKFKLTSFSTAQNIGDNFGSRIRGFIKPTVTGNYKFFIASDDNSQLFLSTGLDESDKVQIASVPDYTNFGQWNKYPSQQSDFIQLEAGKYYYIEALHKEGGGGDFVQVGWQLPNGQLQQPIPGAVLTPYFDGLVIDKFDWDFGDGSAIVTAKDTSHRFSFAGDYKVKLTASTKTCSSTDSITVKVAEEIIDSLIFLDTAACTPFEIQVIDSSNANRLIYVFGDGQRDTINHVLGDTFSYTYFNNTNQSRFYNFTATLKGQFACEKELVQTIEIYPGPPGTIEIDAPFPPCAPFQLKAGNAQFKNNLTYTWLLNDSIIDTDSSIVAPLKNNSPSLRNDVLSLLVESAEGCSKLVTQKFNVYPEPDYQLIQSPDSGCSELKVQFAIDKFAQSYLWDFGDGKFSSAPSPNNSYKLTTKDDSTFTVRVDLLSPFSCPDTLFSTVYVQKNIKANFIASPQTQTYPDTTINLINLSSGPIDDFHWVFASDTIKKDTSSYSFVSVGTKIVQLVATNEFCTSIAKDTIVILPPVPTAQFVGGGVGCINAKFEFTNQSKFADSYIWYFGDGKTSTQENPTHTYTKIGKFNVSLKVTGIGGTDSTITFDVVEIIEKPVSKFTVTRDTLYLPDSIFSYLSQSTGTIQNTKWISGDGDTSLNVNAVSFNYGKTGNYKPKLIVSNTIQACVDTASIDVWLLPELPRASFIGSGIGCAPLSVKFTNTSTKAQFLRWDFGDGSVSFEPNPTHIYTSVGNYSVKLYVANQIGEDSTTLTNVAQVTSKPIAKFSIANDSLNFPDTTFTLVNTSTGNFTEVLWKSGDGDVSTDLSSVDFSYQTIQQYGPKLIVKNAIPNCIDSVSVPLWLLPAKPIASFNGSDTACAPLTVSFENTSKNAQFVKWDFGDGKTSSEFNPFHTYSEEGTYTVKLYVSNDQGEDSVRIFNAIKVLEKPIAKFEVNKDSLIYPDTTFVFENKSSKEVISNIWNFESRDTSINSSFFPYGFERLGQQIVSLSIATGFDKCVANFTDTVFIKPPFPVADFIGSSSGCLPVTVTFQNLSKYADSYFWEFGDGSFSKSSNPTHTYSQPGIFEVTLTVTNATGSDAITKVSVEVYDYPSALFTTNPVGGTEIVVPVNVFFNNKSSNAKSYLWDFGDGSSSTTEKPLHRYTSPGTFPVNLIAVNEFGCADTFELAPPLILIDGGKLVVPNAFSPNIDGPSARGDIEEGLYNNDIFFPKIKGTAEVYKMYVFNRWGELLFVSEDQNIGWDGYYLGELCKQDVYVYKIEVTFKDGRTEVLTGDFALIR